jgi:putative transposase
MPKNLKRYYGKHDLHFLTCTCYRRMPLLSSARSKGVFAKILGEVRDRYGFLLVGYVVMPNHIHPKDWPWSSYSHYAMGKEGLVRIDDVA